MYKHYVWEDALDISQMDGKITVTLSLSVADFARALADGELRLRFDAGAAVQLDEGGNAALAAVCAAYGPESLGANLMWEIAQAGDAGIGAGALKDLLGLAGSKQLAGVFSGIAKVLAREMPGAAAESFIERRWQSRAAEFHYRMAAPVRDAVLKALG